MYLLSLVGSSRELEDLGLPTFAETVVRYRGQLLELKTSSNQTGFHNIKCAKEKRGRNNPYYAKTQVPPAWREEAQAADAAGVNVSYYCRGRCPPSWPGTWRRSRSCEPLFLSPSLTSQPRCAAAMHCVSYHVYSSRTLTHSCPCSCRRRFT